MFILVNTVNLTWSESQLKQNIKEDGMRATDKGKHRRRQEDDASMDVGKTKQT